MIDVKRMGYLFVLALLAGMVLVYLRTARMQAVYRLTSLGRQEQQWRQTLWEQQARLSAGVESPRQVRQEVSRLGLGVLPPQADPAGQARAEVAAQEKQPNRGGVGRSRGRTVQ